MDSKIVNREIRRTIRPFLKEAGFTRFSGRNSWRYTDTRVEVVNFQSFNAYHAGCLGCTTYSFSVKLGSYLLDVQPIGAWGKIKEKDGHLRPDECQCPLRGSLSRGFRQRKLKDRRIWFIDPEGRSLEKAMRDVLKQLEQDALPWFERLRDTNEVLRILQEEPEDMDRLWGFGRNPSPIRTLMTAYTALTLNRTELAREKLSEALQSGSFNSLSGQLRQAIEACGPAAD